MTKPCELPRDSSTDEVKPFSELNVEHKRLAQLNARALNYLHCGISPSEFTQIMNLHTAFEVWKKLEVTYEGTSQVKETKINILTHDYELFRMNPN